MRKRPTDALFHNNTSGLYTAHEIKEFLVVFEGFSAPPNSYIYHEIEMERGRRSLKQIKISR